MTHKNGYDKVFTIPETSIVKREFVDLLRLAKKGRIKKDNANIMCKAGNIVMKAVSEDLKLLELQLKHGRLDAKVKAAALGAAPKELGG